MKVIAIILWVLQCLSIIGCLVDPPDYNFFNWVGFFLPTIIGIILWFKASKKQKENSETKN